MRKSVIICILGLFLTGCILEVFTQSPRPPLHVWTEKFIENTTCEPPCWESIIPGTTTFEETRSIIKGLPNVTSLEELYFEGTRSLSWNFVDDNDREKKLGGGEIRDDKNGIIRDITIGFENNKSLTIEKFIARFGEPTTVRHRGCIHGSCEFA